jgi:hypothetical protein
MYDHASCHVVSPHVAGDKLADDRKSIKAAALQAVASGTSLPSVVQSYTAEVMAYLDPVKTAKVGG